jgi:hypothetical protein
LTSGKSPAAGRQAAEASATRHELTGSLIVVLMKQLIASDRIHELQHLWASRPGAENRPRQKTQLRIGRAAGIQAFFHQIHHQVAQGPSL